MPLISKEKDNHIKINYGRKSGLVIAKLDSRLEGRGFKAHPILGGNGVRNRFLHPILVHLIEKKENIGSQMGHTKKIFEKINFYKVLK